MEDEPVLTREQHYIMATTLAKLRIVDQILRDVLPEILPAGLIDQAEYEDALVKVNNWQVAVYEAMTGDESPLRFADDDDDD